MEKAITIGRYMFASPFIARSFIQELRDRYEPGEKIKPSDTEFVGDLFKAHPDYLEMLAGRELSHFEVRTYQYQPRCFFAVFTNDESIAFSFMTVVDHLSRAA